MAWVVLIVSGVLEAVWATALGRAEGFTRLAPSIVFLVALALSMVGLSYAVKTLPTGTSYAVWVGIGASLTVAYGMLSGTEPVSVAKVLLIIGLIACVIGLKLVHDASLDQNSPSRLRGLRRSGRPSFDGYVERAQRVVGFPRRRFDSIGIEAALVGMQLDASVGDGGPCLVHFLDGRQLLHGAPSVAASCSETA